MPSDDPAVTVDSSPTAGGTPLRILVVCTANVCRSPVAEHLLQRHLDGRAVAAVVRSAGTHGGHTAVHRHTARAAEGVGVDLADHVSRPLDREVLRSDGADLVVTMTREHLRHVTAVDPGAWSRAFTLKEVVRRASAVDPTTTSDLAAWRATVAEGRSAASMMGDDPDDDVFDPYGGPAAGHAAMVTEVGDLTSALARLLASTRR
jgi:protein-tyrosine phosphatase